jgi:undecaprenyl-phosphate galactose phosphotransferase/putative colanic acid biosynthesis UDP-glucose lipid carrier transferase
LGATVQIARQSSFAAQVERQRFGLPCRALPLIAAAVDAALLLSASVLGQSSYQFYLTGSWPPLDEAVGIGAAAVIVFTLSARLWGLYRIRILLAPVPQLHRVVATLAVSLFAASCILFLLKVGAQQSRGGMVVFAALAAALTPLGRLVVAAALRKGVRCGAIRGRRVVALGDATELARFGEPDFLQFGIEEIARIAIGSGSNGAALSENDRARIVHAIDVARQLRAAEFSLFMPWTHARALAEVCELLRNSPLPVRLYPDQRIRDVLARQAECGFDERFTVTVQRSPMSVRERALKRATDLVLATSALVAFAPLLLLTSLLVRIDSPGPVIFRQRRCGFDNREFVIFKFRTMTVLEDGDSIVQAKPDDARVTRIGKFLRRSSLDELPQLINVVRGDMSLVGPRPHAIAHDDEYKARINNYALRHNVKPGLTGAAQVMGLRGETQRLSEMERRVERDLWYIDNWSLTLDLKLIAKTCVTLFRFEAY